MTGGFCDSWKREKSDLLACSLRARAAEESKVRPDEPEEEDDDEEGGFETDFEELELLLESDEKVVPEPDV